MWAWRRQLGNVLRVTFAGILLAIASPQAFASELRDLIESRIEAGLAGNGDMVWSQDDGERGAALSRFYAERDHAPLWVGEDGALPKSGVLLSVLRNAEAEGLRSQAYAPGRIARLIDTRTPRELARLELLLSHTLLIYASDLRHGRLRPEMVAPDLAAQPPSQDISRILRGAANADDPAGYLKDLAPANPGYHRLRRALTTYRRIAAADGWPRVSDGRWLESGMRGREVATLRRHLQATGDLTVTSSDPEFFGLALKQAVERYQARHGLKSDGVVGPRTRAQLEIPVETRIRQIEINMERWRWMPDDLGERYVLVNLAGFEVELVESGATSLYMRAVVGRPYRKTPVFSDRITYVELNPTWTVPPTIMRKDVLPKVRQDVGYLAEHNMQVYAGWSAEAPRVDPTKVDWAALDPRRIPYRFVQAPGPKNPLGRVKFMFPNRFHVYLHDTPQRDLFLQAQRTFSSGCIRVDKPMELLDHLLAGQAEWDRARVQAVLKSGKTTRVPLKHSLPIHLIYATAWIGEGGTIHFRDDVYGRDELVDQALSALELSQTSVRETASQSAK
ncbi:L,D-transpeptidase family protein [Ferruginivarius sediminum]|uniref:Peptidoglycan-binding protein n=1 Tax=Ferruginivarius sediminum TaxID=2661937 RepID=A0A369TFC8_9PROT|nr:L,D-transpeptidase family protein [Ferruginivarius sediminum]RDD63532.1 peptidoglycan-binding protein [Ferruginivarius sediminum]